MGIGQKELIKEKLTCPQMKALHFALFPLFAAND